MEALPDPIVDRFRPDPELLAIAQRNMLEHENQRERFMRQRWEHALGAARVAMDSLREIWPSSRGLVTSEAGKLLDMAHGTAEDLVEILDTLDETMLGQSVVGVLNATFTTRRELERFIHGPDGAPPSQQPSEMVTLLRHICENPGGLLEASSMDKVDLQWLKEQEWITGELSAPHPTPRAMDEYPNFPSL